MGIDIVTGAMMGTATTMGSQRWVSGRAGLKPSHCQAIHPVQNYNRGIAAELTRAGFET